MKIIFLDMDGVINSRNVFVKATFDKSYKEKCLEERLYPFLIDTELRAKINEILNENPDCYVVWSSTWRRGLRDSKLFIEGFYNKCGFRENSFLGYTPILNEKRYIEILKWLKLNSEKYKIEKCVIIDDDSDAKIDLKELKKINDKDLIKIAKKYNPVFFQTFINDGMTDKIKNEILNYFKD